ncbi:MAG: PIN domain-containing protein [Pirellulales bacterium]
MSQPAVVLDTNVFVAAAFNRRSASARILEEDRSGRLRMVWNEATRRETRHILEKIPRLSWNSVADLFREEDRYRGETFPEQFADIPDPDDRKFAALADASGAVLLTNDEHLLKDRDRASIEILTPQEFWNRASSKAS